MSLESAKAFYERIEKDENLAEQYKQLLLSLADKKADEAQIVEGVIQFASRNGFNFSGEDIKQVCENLDSDRITDTQLNNAAGGGFGITYVLFGAGGSVCLGLGFSKN